MLRPVMAVFCGVAALVGHLFPIYLGFRGGKGVATGAGVLMAVNWITVAVGIGVFLVVFLPLRYVSVGSIAASISVPVTQFFTRARFFADAQEQAVVTVFCAVLAILIILKHRPNIKRLLKGEEPKFTFSKAQHA